MKAVLICIQPQWCELIANGKKTIEVRKTRPKLDTPFKVYIYCTLSGSNEFFKEDCKGDNAEWNRSKMALKKGKVIGEFVCDKIRFANGTNFIVEEDAEATLKGSCLTKEDIYKYLGVYSGMSRYDKKTEFYRWHISDLLIYDKPKELSEFINYNRCSYGGLVDCKKCGEHHCLKRPPQSWCYVEEGSASE